jgi:cytochrome P450
MATTLRTEVTEQPLPSHISAEMVRPYPLGRGKKTTRHPHDIASQIHRDHPEAFYVPGFFVGSGAWVFRRAADIRTITLDTDHFSNKDFSPYARLSGGTWTMVPAEQDPPNHALYRAMVNPLFTPKSLSVLEQKLRTCARGYISAFSDRGSCEFMNDFAFKFPIRIFLELMNLPIERIDEFLQWEMTMLRSDDISKIEKAVRNATNYLQEEIELRRNGPGDDFIGYGIKAEIGGRKLTDDELIGFCFNLFIGGLDTVSAHMGHIFRHLAENPGHQAGLRSNREIIPTAIEEFMRAYGSVTTTRRCIKETMINGVTLLPGDRVAVSGPLAGRDPEEYDEPDEVRLNRRPHHLSFGYGPHFCVGMHLARREIRLGLEEFFNLVPEFEIAGNATIVSDLGSVMLPFSLPLIWKV